MEKKKKLMPASTRIRTMDRLMTLDNKVIQVRCLTNLAIEACFMPKSNSALSGVWVFWE
ncbi:hypothetical protein HYPBUDRAFT_151787 [Hyphopichia burtonii NRRL Y-1933]|uniref:Uncharacterized protein n=1 Tax=Hyphopichia burtonii NRRL Y-1933 TaxID=984485 RepID=A0A1E4RT84_9ASCO|nr:hypothetical protein HYPBUDRAFT_151787 [Hyphopichia burtonii NRRL Y-1933]ODV70483.1 hypothetical protein HYPBUDRAFT_151787 [Hyphopichia burtonii NRRL Y-1933]